MEHEQIIHLEHRETNPYLFVFTGLDIPYLEYEKIYTPFYEQMNITILQITQEFISSFEEQVTTLATYILSLNLKEVYFVAHSFSGIVVYKLALLLPDIYFYTVLLDPSTSLSKPSIQRNPSFSASFKERLIELLDEVVLYSDSVHNMETLLITYFNVQKIRQSIKSINRIPKKEKRPNTNYTRFIEFYNKLARLEQNRLTYFNDMYHNAHYILLPLDHQDNLKKIYPHYIYSHRPTEIVDYIRQFFAMSTTSTPVSRTSRIKVGGKSRVPTRNTHKMNRVRYAKRYIPSIVHNAYVKKAIAKHRKGTRKGTRKVAKRKRKYNKSKKIVKHRNGTRNVA